MKHDKKAPKKKQFAKPSKVQEYVIRGPGKAKKKKAEPKKK